MPQPKISVIMPCYNADAIVKWSITSVLNQTFVDFELICVDDKSTDTTLSILNDIAKTDSRLTVVEAENNEGPGAARNLALSLAQGEFVSFIDSDDFYEPDFLSTMMEAQVEEDADLVQCGIRYIYATSSRYNGAPAGTLKGEHCHYRIDMFDGLPHITPHPCNKLIRRSAFNSVEFADHAYEDTQVLPRLLLNVRKAVVISPFLYNYNKIYSGVTGTTAALPEKIDFYLQSLDACLKPYLEPDFQLKLKRWGAPLPACAYANLANYLRTVDASWPSYTDDEKRSVHRQLEAFLSSGPSRYSDDTWEQILAKLPVMQNVPIRSETTGRPTKLSRAVEKGKKAILKVFETRLSTLDKLVPKDPNLWVFSSWGHYNEHTIDNPRAVFEAAKGLVSVKKVILMNSPHQGEQSEHPNVRFVNLQSFEGLLTLIRCGRIYAGYSLHALYGYRRLANIASRKIVQLWHGIPIKTVGLEVPRRLEPFWPLEVKRYSALTSSSDIDRQTMRKSFAPDAPEKIKLTGLPRNDLISMPEETLPRDYQRHLTRVRTRLGGKRLVLFAPTWRYQSETSISFSTHEMEQLDALLKRHRAMLGIRYHRNMMQKGSFQPYVSNNVCFFNDIADASILLREARALITDYSSIYLDFMVLDRPVILYTPDIQDYKGNRGFNYLPDEFIPTDSPATTFEDICGQIETSLQPNFTPCLKYLDVKSRFHKYELDGRCSDRLLAAIQD